jgi:hypothetical protein
MVLYSVDAPPLCQSNFASPNLTKIEVPLQDAERCTPLH